MDITIEKVPHSGALILSTLAGNRLITKTYYGYSKREAKAAFREYVRDELKGNR